MKDAILAMLKSLVGSKKFAALLVGLLSTLLVTKLGLPEEQAAAVSAKVVGLVAAYMASQGLADLGKEKAKVEQG